MANNQITPFQLTDQFTMDNFNQRINETNTALQNKAPAGFGLGTFAQYIDDFNNAVLTGWYQNQSKGEEAHTPDGSIGWIVRTESFGTGCYAQFAYRVGSTPLGVYQAVRYYHSAMGGWNAWEWFNPPMYLGVEYRTTERYLGRPVYVLTAEFGSNINGSIVYFGKDALRVVRGLALAGDGDSLYPWWNGNTVNNWTAFFDFATGVDPEDSVRKVKVTCWSQTGASASYGHNIVKVYYTKSTD